MSANPLPDLSQQPITSADPRVAKILALIQAQRQPVATIDAPPSSATVPSLPSPTVPQQLGGPTLAQQAAPDVGPAPAMASPQMQGAPPQLPPPPAPSVTPTPQPGPVKSFLQQLVSGLGSTAYAGSQGALQRLGIPTDYEKQQNAAKLSLQQQQQDSLEGLRQTQADQNSQRTLGMQAQLAPMKIPDDPKYGAFAGQTLPTSAATVVMQKMEALQNAKDISSGKNATTLEGKQLQYGPGSYLRRATRSIGGRIISYDKGDPDNKALQKDLGVDTAMITGPNNANARARANAAYRTFDTVDGDGNPVTISGLDALQGGAAHTPYTQAKGVKSDLVGIQQYDQILGRISSNLPVLNDNAQRIAIAHTLSEADKNPGALQAMITSGLQEHALTPAGAQLVADIMQGREFGGVARKYGGNMNGTEGLMNRIMANQASPLNSVQVNKDLIANDQAFTKKANLVVSGMTRHNAGNSGGPPNVTPAASVIYAVDQNGVTHQAPAGTPLPAGWKAK